MILPTPTELAIDWCLGLDPPAPRVDPPAPSPVAALEEVLRKALARPPCVVAFSGGRDSTILLCLAARLARREGLPLPVPSSQQFPLDPDADERVWQELVIRELDLPEWHRVEVRHQNDLVGEAPQALWERCGYVWPPRAYTAVPSMIAAAGGSFVTGDGGDDVFKDWPWRSGSELLARRRISAKGLRNLAHGLAPVPVRQRVMGRRNRLEVDWLRPEVAESVVARFAADAAGAPFRYDDWLRWLGRSRTHRVAFNNVAALARTFGAETFFPFWDAGFHDALGRWAGPRGRGGRTEAVQALFGDVLPQRVAARETKAHTSHTLWGDETRRFVESWSGRGLWEEIVDPDRVRQAWRDRTAVGGSIFGLLQLAWLSDHTGEGAQELVDDAIERSHAVARPSEVPAR